MAYDASEHDDSDKIVIGSKKHDVQSKPEPVSSPCDRIEDVSTYIFKRSASSAQTFHDGRLVLRGFVLSEKPVAEDRW